MYKELFPKVFPRVLAMLSTQLEEGAEDVDDYISDRLITVI